MKRALDDGNVKEALKHASSMIFELRSSQLTPQNYYDLYISVTDELRYLENVLLEEQKRNLDYDLYEVVQYAGNIVPRLYLLITVGAVYIKNRAQPPMTILKDLVDLCKGVQHPTRGLFLRCYLSQIAKDLLPDAGSDFYQGEKDLKVCIDFIIQNFTEVNRLWVRMQHQGPVRDRARREIERQNLRMLVGTNLVRLSNLEGLTIELYQSEVLPKILELIVECNDKIAQEYLMDCCIQVFPDEYHLRTLEVFLDTLPKLNEEVNVKNIIISMMNRLSAFVQQSTQSISTETEMFSLFHQCAAKVMQEKKEMMSLEDVLSLQVALINFASKVYPDRLQYLDDVLEFTSKTITAKGATNSLNDACSKHVVNLLSFPLETISLNVFKLRHYAELMRSLNVETRRQVALSIAKAVVDARVTLSSTDILTTVLDFISPLLKDPEGATPLFESNQYEFEEEQFVVAKLIHVFSHEDTDQHYQLLLQIRSSLGEGGEHRLKRLLPSLFFEALRLVERCIVRESSEDDGQTIKPKKVFQFIHKVVTVLVPIDPHMALRLFLQAAIASDKAAYDAITYEFLTQAFVVYEEEVADSKELVSALSVIVGTVQVLRNLSEENYEAISTQATQQAARLLKKPDKANAINKCTHMFWSGTDENPGVRKGKVVLMCLQRSLKIANSILDETSKASLFIQILDKYLFFFEKNVEEILPGHLKNLIELIQGLISEMDTSLESQKVKSHFTRTLNHLRQRKSDPESRCAKELD